MDPDAARTVERVPHGSDSTVALDFSANCNPVLPPGARDAYERAFDESTHYPRDDYPEFRAAAADYVGCGPEAVVPTAGGLAAIRLALGVSVRPGDSVLVPFPSFGEYGREVRLQGGVPAFVPHDELLDADPTDHAVAVVCTPNNPTGDLPERETLLGFVERCRAADCLVLADEAFLDFTDQASLAGTDGVVVARSLTKLFGLPGLRAGFACATGDVLDALHRAVSAWALGTPAASVGAHCLRQTDFVTATRERVAREQAFLRDRLGAYAEVAPSVAPFLLCDVGTDPAPLLGALRERGIALRDATTFRGLDTHVRVAVRTRADHERLLDALAEVHDVLD